MVRSRDPVDVHVGKMIRARRKLAEVSQEALAKAIGVTFQQVQKYESGGNRVSASRLVRIAQVLDAPIAEFFPEVADDGRVAGLGPAGQLAVLDGGQQIAMSFIALDPDRRRALLSVAQVLNTTMPGEEPGQAYVNGGDAGEARRVAG